MIERTCTFLDCPNLNFDKNPSTVSQQSLSSLPSAQTSTESSRLLERKFVDVARRKFRVKLIGSCITSTEMINTRIVKFVAVRAYIPYIASYLASAASFRRCKIRRKTNDSSYLITRVFNAFCNFPSFFLISRELTYSILRSFIYISIL